ncbi:ROK family protein [Nakamurella endophytica]|uniref:ROK family protein n=1 Tax=Nakamurella endophytica TaxID=1748367 RepID=UPI001E37DB6B|nr:ROK family protein [Nakamurella endophytica]
MRHGTGTDWSRRALAVDIGGTKFAAAVVTELGEIVASRRMPTPRSRDGDVLFAALTEAVDAVLHAVGLEPHEAAVLPAVGVATAAPLDLGAGTVSPVNIPGWRDFPLRDRLVERYGCEVRMLGDAVAVAVGEHWRGAARGRRNVLGMVVSTGVGGGVVVDGRVVAGTTGNAGHIGHVSVDPFGPACVCGGTGCLEAVASGTSITRWAREHGLADGDAAAGAAGVADAALRGDPIALATFRRAGEAIGLAVAGAVTLLDLDVVVIGGGVALAGPVLFDPIADGYARYAALGYASSPRVVPALLGGDAGLIGAAGAVLRADAYWPHGR